MAVPTVRYFLGANSPNGFYSLYDQLIDPATAEDIFILKGGAGCGKSSLMRRVGKAMEDKGLLVEYILCSGDPDSLDAIVIPALKTAIVDGTAPHERATIGHNRRKVGCVLYHFYHQIGQGVTAQKLNMVKAGVRIHCKRQSGQ